MGMMGYYILDEDGEPKRCNDLIEWARWCETANRHVAETYFGRVRVSTVFLALDHGFVFNGRPVLFETMIFGGWHNYYTARYTSRQYALIGREQACQLVSDWRLVPYPIQWLARRIVDDAQSLQWQLGLASAKRRAEQLLAKLRRGGF